MCVQGDDQTAELVLIDFGLSAVEQLVEAKGVDLYVLERALVSAHPGSEPIFECILGAYSAANVTSGPAVRRKLDQVRARGRKRDMLG